MPKHIVRMEDAYLSYKSKPALRGMSFAVEEGEIFGFLGPSGAGKTTTIKLLTRQLRADKGSIAIFGEDINAINADVYDRVGVLSDNSGLYERLTVYENLVLFADIMKVQRKEINALLERIGLDKDINKPAKQLSRGMKQRLMLARAILHRPKLLFLDEPTASLDPANTQQIHSLLRELNAEGATIFLTTHNMYEADELCTRVAFIVSGAIALCDTPEALKLSHAHDEVIVKTRDGKIHKVSKKAHELSGALNGLADDDILSIHSSEPNLEEIFLMTTGRDLV